MDNEDEDELSTILASPMFAELVPRVVVCPLLVSLSFDSSSAVPLSLFSFWEEASCIVSHAGTEPFLGAFPCVQRLLKEKKKNLFFSKLSIRYIDQSFQMFINTCS